jgi:hypothetical protein
MLSRALSKKANLLLKQNVRCFSHGPYNPMSYKHQAVPEGMPSTEEYYTTVKSMHENPPPPLYNMRHIHPVR